MLWDLVFEIEMFQKDFGANFFEILEVLLDRWRQVKVIEWIFANEFIVLDVVACQGKSFRDWITIIIVLRGIAFVGIV